MLKIENTYSTLDKRLFSNVLPDKSNNTKLILLNHNLVKKYKLPFKNDFFTKSILSGNSILDNSIPIAQAYAGHQFGYFNILGDGRAILLFEFLNNNLRYDLQLKGSGITPYSRSGDGKATLYSMLREYIISEGMHNLKIPTSRCLSVISTGEKIYRHDLETGAVLSRISKSHIRIGTFEYVAFLNDRKLLKEFTDYSIKRHYPNIFGKKNMYFSFLDKVAKKQIDLVINWLRVGFIHGVMNTDNTTISGETIDYGPCAFLNGYSKNKYFSSIDINGRYSFLNQKTIILYNLSKLANSIIPILDGDIDSILKVMRLKIIEWEKYTEKSYYTMMGKKIGISNITKDNYFIIDDLLNVMELNSLDYTNTFVYLFNYIKTKDLSLINEASLINWIKKWEKIIDIYDLEKVLNIMKKTNPLLIPRNDLVELALDEAVKGNLSSFELLLDNIKNPYDYDNINNFYMNSKFNDEGYKTYCGT